MAEPRYVIAMGSCQLQEDPLQIPIQCLRGVDKIIPVDVIIPGCPPRPEALIEGFLKLKAKLNKPEIAKVKRNA